MRSPGTIIAILFLTMFSGCYSVSFWMERGVREGTRDAAALRLEAIQGDIVALDSLIALRQASLDSVAVEIQTVEGDLPDNAATRQAITRRRGELDKAKQRVDLLNERLVELRKRYADAGVDPPELEAARRLEQQLINSIRSLQELIREYADIDYRHRAPPP
jgi:septal ring factor EnvC (AmiA/AmiB activator)